MKNRILLIVLILSIFLTVMPPFVLAGPYASWYNFQCITFNYTNPDGGFDCDLAENQLQLEVMGYYKASGHGPAFDVWFTFRSLEVVDYEHFVLSEIYLDDPTHYAMDKNPDAENFLDFIGNIYITHPTDDIAFNIGLKPGDLPGGNNLLVETEHLLPFTSNFSAEPDNPEPQYGIEPGEEVAFAFNYNDSLANYQEMLDFLADASVSVGLHVKSFGSGLN